MVSPIPINIVVEDDLTEATVRRIISYSKSRYVIGYCYGKAGFGYIKQKLRAFDNAAKGTPYLVISDLVAECPPLQINEWLDAPMNSNLIFRIAVHEIESWIIADREGFASFLGIRQELIPYDVDDIDNPKQFLISLARRSRRKSLREAIVPKLNSTARVGPDYNGKLSSFVTNYWNLDKAIKNSPSLRRAFNAIDNFHPIWSKS